MGLCAVSGVEAEYIKELKSLGVLTHVTSGHEYRKFDQTFETSVYWGCPDCHLLLKKLKYHSRSLGQLLHPLGQNGGGCVFHPKSPINQKLRCPFPIEYFIEQIISTGMIKNTRSVSVYSHAPCGAARFHELSVPEQIELTIIGRGVIEQNLGLRGANFEVVPFFHVHWGEMKEDGHPETDNTYLISRIAWLDTRSRFARELSRLPEDCRLFEPALA